MKRFMAFLMAALMSGPLAASELGDDGLHKADWMRDTFMDLTEDLEEANAEGKRLMLLIEQRGCIYCKKMHEEVFSSPDVRQALTDNFFVLQINMFGDVEVTDFDGTVLAEKDMVRRWGLLFTPTMIFLPETVADGSSAVAASVGTMPGAFGKHTTLHLLQWVVEKGYDGDEPFQKYHARKLEEKES